MAYPINMNLREALSSIRKSKKINQIKMAKHLGVPSCKISRFENHKGPLSLEDIQKYANYLGLELRLLIKE